MGSRLEATRIRSRSGDGGRDQRARVDGRRPAEPGVDPRSVAAHGTAPTLVLGLQRTAGNSAVTALVRRSLEVQRKGAAALAAPPWAASTRPVLKLGDGPSPSVAQLQQALNSAVPGGDPLRVTGVFDAPTETKVKQFQATTPPLPSNGIADKRTWWHLDREAPRVTRQGTRTVLGPVTGEARATPDAGRSIRPSRSARRAPRSRSSSRS